MNISVSHVHYTQDIGNTRYFNNGALRCFVFRNSRLTVCRDMSVDTMLTVLIILSVICGVLMLLTISVCCYICARRYYIKVRLNADKRKQKIITDY